MSFWGLLSSIFPHSSLDIERCTIVLDIMDTILGARRNLFSINITLKPASDRVPLPPPSPTVPSADVNARRKDDSSDFRLSVLTVSVFEVFLFSFFSAQSFSFRRQEMDHG